MDSDAEFIFVPREKVMEVAKGRSAIPFDIEDAELMHYVDHVDFIPRCQVACNICGGRDYVKGTSR